MFFHLFYVMSLNPNHKLSKNHKNKPLVCLFVVSLFVCCCLYGQMNFLLNSFCETFLYCQFLSLCFSSSNFCFILDFYDHFYYVSIPFPFSNVSYIQKNHISFIQITQSQKRTIKCSIYTKVIPFNIYFFLFLFAPFF